MTQFQSGGGVPDLGYQFLYTPTNYCYLCFKYCLVTLKCLISITIHRGYENVLEVIFEGLERHAPRLSYAAGVHVHSTPIWYMYDVQFFAQRPPRQLHCILNEGLHTMYMYLCYTYIHVHCTYSVHVHTRLCMGMLLFGIN